jgi:hypothetical protein
MRERLQEAAAELELSTALDDRQPRLADQRLALLEEFLGFLPGSRLDLLTNIALSPERIRDGYLT